MIVFNSSGHSHFELGAYDMFLSKKLGEYDYPDEEVRDALRHLPGLKGWDFFEPFEEARGEPEGSPGLIPPEQVRPSSSSFTREIYTGDGTPRRLA